MAVAGACVEDVKDAVRGGIASQSTITAFQTLMGLESATIPAKTTRPPPGLPSTRRTKPAIAKTPAPLKSASTKTKKSQSIAICEDAPKPLSPREKYALATETVNSGLKVLTEAVKALHRPAGSLQDESPSTPASASRAALQPRSKNITPRRSPEKAKLATRTSPETPSKNLKGPSAHLVATAECTRMAFAFLRSADTQKLGVREMPKLQLETGMLALVGKVIPLGMESVAVKELRHIKRRLETLFGAKKDAKVVGANSKMHSISTERETLASLLQINVDFGDDYDAVRLGITYYMHVLKVIALSSKPAVIEEAAQYLEIERTNSPADLLLRLSRDSLQAAKAAKQLESLSQNISSLCPSPSSSRDTTAIDRSRHASPETVIKLQTITLQVRQRWWAMTKHRADLERELLEPLLRCAVAFIRRSTNDTEAVGVYERLSDAFRSIWPVDAENASSSALYSLHHLLSQQAECAGRREAALHWNKAVMRGCNELGNNHARKVAAAVKEASLVLGSSTNCAEFLDLDGILEGLDSKLTGTAPDFDNLLSCLHGLAITASAYNIPNSLTAKVRNALVLAASIAQRYARSYPGRGTNHVMAILNTALRTSRGTDDLLSWVTAEAATVFIQAGALSAVAEAAAKRPLADAWEASCDAISLSRICRAVLLSKLRSLDQTAGHLVLDDETLPTGERGALLELQLESAMQLSAKTKYHMKLRQIISDVVRSLSNAYVPGVHPVRRLRVTVATLRLHATCPDLVPAEALAELLETFDLDQDQLHSDFGLQPYLEDLKAAFDISKAFCDGSPSFDQLQPALLCWSRLVQGCPDAADLRSKIYDTFALAQQLRMFASYLGMRGEEHLQFPVLCLLDRIALLLANGESDALSKTSADLASCYLDLGCSDRAGKLLAQTQVASPATLNALECQLVRAQYFLETGNLEECNRALADCSTLRERLPPDSVCKDQRRAYESLHARAWLLQSRHALESGSPHEGLVAAKRSVKILNSIWAALERTQDGKMSDTNDKASEDEAVDSSVSNLAKGVSKLQLTPKDDSANASPARSTRGAVFWPLVPVLTKALMHLSDVYSYHGLFSEANYYSERAISIAESVGATILLSRARSHRAQLLSLAGRLEEAELCLTLDEGMNVPEISLAAVERLCAQASVRSREGSLETAVEKLERARQVVDKMSSEEFVVRLERLDETDPLAEKVAALSIKERKPPTGANRTAKASAKRPGAKPAIKKPLPNGAQTTASLKPEARQQDSCSFLSMVKADVVVQAIILKLKLGRDVGDEISQLKRVACSATAAWKARVAEHLHLMTQANAALEMDVTMNVLAESTLSVPSFEQPAGVLPADDAATSTKGATKTKKATSKSKPAAPNQIVATLQAARDCLLRDTSATSGHGSTIQAHLGNSLLTKATILMSAISDQPCSALVQPVQQSFCIDQPRMKAVEYERHAVEADKAMSDVSDPLSWPAVRGPIETETITAANFQEQYIDIIPSSWTAVSLCLNEDASELYIARYRCKQDPLILRLPFSRHKPNNADEEAFDYARGKAELQEIIELSNYTCHNSRNMDAKGAKTTWWSDREALDRRMHELLINMENIWFGGFKSIFSHEQRDEELLARFHRSFEDALDRYLPSRQAVKAKGQRLALDDRTLELFIGLGHDQDGVIDLDEPLADLLYFAVDMLQFSGERNAYDEIDFDSMAVDVHDAMRSYHEARNDDANRESHLILVLDRRLQAFPWENMPCLQGESVSRVGSMQSLWECIVATRSTNSEGRHVVERTSGTYILNPSSDLKATQTMLSPALASLKDSSGQPWTSIMNEAPDEQCFSTALQDSSVLLYFGHGAGSQYIRPRAIKRLHSCSEVVWLMGCSSGAVTENGDLEPSAVPHAYLLAGGSHNDNINENKSQGKCMAVLATLWDVTDKDIDRFSLAVGEEWGLWPASTHSHLPAKTPKKRTGRQIVDPSTPQQVSKTPKTPKVRKTPAPAKTPARSRREGKEGIEGRKRSLVQAVARSRDACYLRYLNGAAAVVYGVPVYLGD